jgi:hypothetical protein
MATQLLDDKPGGVINSRRQCQSSRSGDFKEGEKS